MWTPTTEVVIIERCKTAMSCCLAQKLVASLSLFLLLLAGCASVPTDYERTESRALEDYQSTRIGEFYAAGEAANPGKSGLGILRYGRNAFLFRIRSNWKNYWFD